MAKNAQGPGNRPQNNRPSGNYRSYGNRSNYDNNRYDSRGGRYNDNGCGDGSYGCCGGYPSNGYHNGCGDNRYRNGYGNQPGYGTGGGNYRQDYYDRGRYGNNNSGNGGYYNGNPNGYGRYRNYGQSKPNYSRPKRDYAEYEPAEPADPSTYSEASGVLEMHPNGYGFLRDASINYDRQRTDPFIPGSLVNKLNLRPGLKITGKVQPNKRDQGPRMMEVTDIDGMAPENYFNVKTFDELTPINPEEWYRLETGAEPVSTRVMDILTPLGKGQRALIVAPPRSGKTVLLQQITQAVTTNYPDAYVVVLLVDERPEEVTDFRRSVKAEVIASSLDCELENHVRLSQFVIERCKRLSEMGKDVFLLMDSITRLARAFNKWVGNTGRTMTGGIDVKAMDIPKKIFSSARAHEEGGSLTIVGTALIDTGSRMDELIFQEFKGTGNMELVLDRRLADRRIWPAIDISKSGTRREEKLFDANMLHAVNSLRRVLTPMNPVEAMEKLTMQLSRFETNADFFKMFTHYGG